MISLHTNLSSIITQQNMATSTSKLNQAIERMSTGYKINHAADNAANYSISTNMNVQLSSYDIASDNIAMGMDLLSTAQDSISEIQDRASRLMDLWTQANNESYGESSIAAINKEVEALVTEIKRMYTSTEYNGIKLLDEIQSEWAREVRENAGLSVSIDEVSAHLTLSAGSNGFIAEVDTDTPDVVVINPESLESAISSNSIIGIGNAETLAKLATLVNGGTSCEGKTIVLTGDIDLSDYQTGEGWNPIGTSSDQFKGTFNGNGHKVTGLYINRDRVSASNNGLFGRSSGEIKNLGVEGFAYGSYSTGLLVGHSSGEIHNCFSNGTVRGYTGYVAAGGLVGSTENLVTDCYSTADVYHDEGYYL